ncbi:MAG: alpha/beta fold hydrolase [Desulfobacteraceae bacterium]|jgi:polyhydroxyalkanoate synthase
MDLDEIPKIRGDLFSLYARYFPALKVAPMSAEPIHMDKRMGFRLLRYKYKADTTANQIKLLIVPHIINRPYILDLSDDVSVVRFLCRQGIEVFMIDWGYPEKRHNDISFAHYTGYVDLGAGLMETDAPFILGYCTGGIIALIWASRFPQKPKALALMATPVDFADWRDPRLIWGKLFNARQVGKHFGNIPGELIDFIGLQLFFLYLPKFAMEPEFWEEFWGRDAFGNNWRRWRWLMDAQAIPRAAYEQFIEDCYHKNLLIQNRMLVNGQRVDLTRISCPVLNLYDRYDHIVPPESVRALGRVYSGNGYQEIDFPSSHVGLAASRKAQNHLWPQVAAWLKKNRKPKMPAGATTSN